MKRSYCFEQGSFAYLLLVEGKSVTLVLFQNILDVFHEVLRREHLPLPEELTLEALSWYDLSDQEREALQTLALRAAVRD